jgi:hypothetical protein
MYVVIGASLYFFLVNVCEYIYHLSIRPCWHVVDIITGNLPVF